MIAIDRMTPGSPPAGFSFARTGRGSEGEWTVTADRTAAAGKVIEQTKGPKIRIHKFKNKTGYHKRQGHRQRLTRVEVTGISK